MSLFFVYSYIYIDVILFLRIWKSIYTSMNPKEMTFI